MKAIEIRPVTKQEIKELDQLYHQTKDVRLRTRSQMILLGIEEKLTAPQIAKIVRKNDYTVRRWIKRFNAEGIQGLSDQPKSGAPAQVTEGYREQLLAVVRRRPRALGQAYSLWTLQRLADFLAEETGLRFSSETVRRILKNNEIVISRPQHKISSPDPDYTLKKRRLKLKETT